MENLTFAELIRVDVELSRRRRRARQFMEGGCRKRKASVVPDEKEEFTKVDISISLVPGNPFNSSLIWGISFLLGELAATSLPRPGWLRMHLQVGAGVRLQVDPGIHRTTL